MTEKEGYTQKWKFYLNLKSHFEDVFFTKKQKITKMICLYLLRDYMLNMRSLDGIHRSNLQVTIF